MIDLLNLNILANSKSLFRKLQNKIIEKFLAGKLGKIVEFGGSNEYCYRNFSKTDTYIVSNIEGSVDLFEDLRNLTFASNSIDHAICISVLQHIYEFDIAINEIIRVLKPGGECLITNGYIFPVCMEHDFYRFTPKFWERRLSVENVEFEIIKLGNKYSAVSNLLMRPYGNYNGFKNILNKLLSLPFTFINWCFENYLDSSPLGVAVIIKKL